MNPIRHPKPLVCDCPECGGRTWTINDVRAHPLFDGRQVNAASIAAVGQLIGHPLRYPSATPAGAWTADRDAPQRGQDTRTAHVRNSDPEAMEVMAVNGQRIAARLDSGEMGGGE